VKRLSLVALLILAVMPYFVGLDDSSIWDANEAFYTETPREMIESGDYISPTFNYQPRLNKPVLSYWIVAGFYRLLGVSLWSERLAIAIGAAILLGATFLAARSLWSTDAGLLAAIALASSPRVLMFARRIFIDVYITMFMGLTLVFFLLAERYPSHRKFFLFLMYVAAGLGMLTKGPIAVVLPAVVFFLYFLLQWRLRDLTRVMLPLGMVIVLAIVAPWYVAVYQRHGLEPVTGFFWGENVSRFTDPVAPERGWFFYAPVLFADLFPWSLFLPLGVWMFLRSPRTERRSHESLLWIWTIVIVVSFSASKTKQDLYIFPIVTATAAIVGVTLARATDPSVRESGGVFATTAAAALVVMAGGALALYLFSGPGSLYGLGGVYSIAAIALGGGVVTLVAASTGRRFEALALLALTVIGLNWMFVLRTLPSFERYKPVPAFTTRILERASPDAAVLHYKVAIPSMVFYMRRPYEGFIDADAFIKRFSEASEAYAVLAAEDYAALTPRLTGPSCEIDRRPFFDLKLRSLLARAPPAELVLITNRCR
jgi:4-amino-4-deoxy-L-arabinose transferase-like glycosyltransferase